MTLVISSVLPVLIASQAVLAKLNFGGWGEAGGGRQPGRGRPAGTYRQQGLNRPCFSTGSPVRRLTLTPLAAPCLPPGAQKTDRSALAHADAVASEALAAIKTVAAFNMQPSIEALYHERLGAAAPGRTALMSGLGFGTRWEGRGCGAWGRQGKGRVGPCTASQSCPLTTSASAPPCPPGFLTPPHPAASSS